MEKFKAFRIHQEGKSCRAGLEELALDDLDVGNVLVEVHYSGINYKDALAASGHARILRKSPLIGGIDASGIVVESEHASFKVGDKVLVTGSGLSETLNGAYSEYLRIDGDLLTPLPDGLTLKEAMIIGTAGFTAGLAYLRMVDNHQTPALGPIAVTGATGGVGSFAIDLLSAEGYTVVAFSRKSQSESYLKELGAAEIRHPDTLDTQPGMLGKATWGGAIDNIGGACLGALLRNTVPWGNVVSVGMASGSELSASVMPFILRGVSLLGVTSANCPKHWRDHLWSRLAGEIKPLALDLISSTTVSLDELSSGFDKILSGEMTGRCLVRIRGD